MASINFYLDKPQPGGSYIFLYIREKGKTTKVLTGEKIPHEYWDAQKQRAKKSRSFPTHSELNYFLKTLSENTHRLLLDFKSIGESYSLEDVRNEVRNYLGTATKPDPDHSFFAVYADFVRWGTIKKGERTVKKYRTLENHLRKFEKRTAYKLSFDRITIQFYDKLEAFYLTDLKVLDSTWHKYLTTFKVFMNWATERGYNAKLDYLKFKRPKLADTDIIYLSESEVQRLYHFDLSDHVALAKTRDVFCIGCFTGLRFSDIAQLKKENIREDYLMVKTYKTKDTVRVPLRQEAKEIIERYLDHPDFLPTMTNQKSNFYLKELGKLAGIDEPTTITQYQGSRRIETEKPKYEFMTTHTGRRTFVTLALEAGARPEIVMEITGHKSYATFRKYIKITDRVVTNEMKRIWGEEKEQNPFMKVAN